MLFDLIMKRNTVLFPFGVMLLYLIIFDFIWFVSRLWDFRIAPPNLMCHAPGTLMLAIQHSVCSGNMHRALSTCRDRVELLFIGALGDRHEQRRLLIQMSEIGCGRYEWVWDPELWSSENLRCQKIQICLLCFAHVRCTHKFPGYLSTVQSRAHWCEMVSIAYGSLLKNPHRL
jgi:hypothetical protein